jgi:hypothetical protein
MKISIKKFFSREPEDTSSVEIKVEVEEKSRTELFNEAVDQVVRDKCRRELREQLTEMCYTEEEVAQTNAAMLEGKWTQEKREKYPKAQVYHTSYDSRPALTFNVESFINRLLEDVV